MAASTATAVVASMPVAAARAAAKFTRKSLQGRNVARDLESYKKAVRAMLALPPLDPRNWYRIAFTHLFDCPHSNWWFLVWHRGYLAHLERICRELSGDPDFALPYWDWTKEPAVPGSFWDDVLDPDDDAYVPDAASFRDRYKPALQAYWDGFSSGQRTQQTRRGSVLGYANFEGFWAVAEQMFFPRGGTRQLRQSAPDLPSWAGAAVQESVISDLLAPRRFVTAQGAPAFESVRADHHHAMPRDYSILEGQPHNLVHGGIGGFMSLFLSPADPIFFMHHCNIDRLWDVWTRKQEARGLPTGPEGAAWTSYAGEEFLFFHDANGDPAGDVRAEDYFETAPFRYDYEPGTGEDAVEAVVAAADVPTAGSENLNLGFGIGAAAESAVALPEALTARMRAPEAPSRFFATVTITPPMRTLGVVFDVFVGAKGEAIDMNRDSDHFAGSFSFFGQHHRADKPASFTIGLTRAVERLRARGALEPGQELGVAVAAAGQEGAKLLFETPGNVGSLNAVKIGTF